MKRPPASLQFLAALVLLFFLSTAVAEEEEVFEYNVSDSNVILYGDDANIGGFLFPELFVIGTGGVFDGDSEAADFATNHHDPIHDALVQAIEAHIILNVNDKITGMIAGFGFQNEDHDMDAELEEAFIHYHVNDFLAIGGGQFLNTFGFQSSNHLHGWDFVNQNLLNSRMLNEGELYTQGGEIVFKTPGNGGALTIGGGGVRSHAHDHDHGDHDHDDHDHDDHDHDEHDHDEHDHDEHDHDEHDHDEHDHDEHDHDEHDHDEEEHHFELEEANFVGRVVSADYRFRLPFDDSITVSTSFATGRNGFGRDTHAYGFGIRKVWNGHDHGSGPEFCTGAVQLQTEFIGRHIEGFETDGTAVELDDQGISTSIIYGYSDRTTVSFRHDWLSGIELADVSDVNRFSAALTSFVDPRERIRARIQYDYLNSDDVGGEHAAWLQFQIKWGGQGGRCLHDH